MKEAKDVLALGQTPEVVASFFPDLLNWGDALAPFLGKHPSLELGVLRPFGGAVFLIRDSNRKHPSNVPRDAKGYSVALRMALYATRLLCLPHVPQIVPKEQEVHYLYFLALTYELVNDQIDLREENMLFASNLDPDSMDEIRSESSYRYFLSASAELLRGRRIPQSYRIMILLRQSGTSLADLLKFREHRNPRDTMLGRRSPAFLASYGLGETALAGTTGFSN